MCLYFVGSICMLSVQFWNDRPSQTDNHKSSPAGKMSDNSGNVVFSNSGEVDL